MSPLDSNRQRVRPVVRVRRARPDEGERLRAIAIEAKAYWGYDRDRVVAWAEQVDLSPDALQKKEVYVADEDGRPVGWASLIPRGDAAWLHDLWIEPGTIRTGVGTLLFRHVAERARSLGASALEWEAEPNALGFYERMGGRALRDSEPSEWGRTLQVMGVDLRT